MSVKTLAAVIVAAGMVFGQTGLTGPQWSLQKLNHSSTNLAGYTLRFITDSTVSAHMQCNSCGYKYTAAASSLTFTQGMCTLVACIGNSRENEFGMAMDNVTKWIRDGQRLFLLSASDTLMEYIDASSPVLSGKGRQVKSDLSKTVTTVIVTGHAIIVAGSKENAVPIRFFDIRGTCLRQASANNGPVAISTYGLSRGMYLLQVSFGTSAPAIIPLTLVK